MIHQERKQKNSELNDQGFLYYFQLFKQRFLQNPSPEVKAPPKALDFARRFQQAVPELRALGCTLQLAHYQTTLTPAKRRTQVTLQYPKYQTHTVIYRLREVGIAVPDQIRYQIADAARPSAALISENDKKKQIPEAEAQNKLVLFEGFGWTNECSQLVQMDN